MKMQMPNHYGTRPPMQNIREYTREHSDSTNLRQGQNLMEGIVFHGGRNIWNTTVGSHKHKFNGERWFSPGETNRLWFDFQMCSKVTEDGTIGQNT